MTLEEKVRVITGQIGRCAGNTGAVERLGVPALCLQDGESIFSDLIHSESSLMIQVRRVSDLRSGKRNSLPRLLWQLLGIGN